MLDLFDDFKAGTKNNEPLSKPAPGKLEIIDEEKSLQLRRSKVIFLRQSLHPEQQAALAIRATRPPVNTTINWFPAAKIEITDTKVGAVGNEKRLLQRRKQIGFDVVEDSRDGCSLARESACLVD